MTPSGWAVDVGELSGKTDFVVDAPYIQSIGVFDDKIWVGGYTAKETTIHGQAIAAGALFLVQLDRTGTVVHVDSFPAMLGPGEAPPSLKIVTQAGGPMVPASGYVAVSVSGHLTVHPLGNLGSTLLTCSGPPTAHVPAAIALQADVAVVAIAVPGADLLCTVSTTSYMAQSDKLGIFTLRTNDLGKSDYVETALVAAAEQPQIAIPDVLDASAGTVEISAVTGMPAKIVHFRLTRIVNGMTPDWMLMSPPSGDMSIGMTTDGRVAGERIAGGIGTWMTGVRTNGSVFVSPFDNPDTNFATDAVVAGTSFRSLATRAPNRLLVGGHVKTPALLGSTNVGCPGDGCASLVLLASDGTVLAPHTFPGKGVISAVTFDPTEATPTKAYVAGTFVESLDVGGNKLTSATEHLFVAEVALNVVAP